MIDPTPSDFVQLGRSIRVVQKGLKGGVPTTVEFEAVITYLDDRRAEYEGGGHKGGFALQSAQVGKMTSMGGIFPRNPLK